MTSAFSQAIKPALLTDTLACFGPTAIKTARQMKERLHYLEDKAQRQDTLLTLKSHQLQEFRFLVTNLKEQVANRELSIMAAEEIQYLQQEQLTILFKDRDRYLKRGKRYRFIIGGLAVFSLFNFVR